MRARKKKKAKVHLTDKRHGRHCVAHSKTNQQWQLERIWITSLPNSSVSVQTSFVLQPAEKNSSAQNGMERIIEKRMVPNVKCWFCFELCVVSLDCSQFSLFSASSGWRANNNLVSKQRHKDLSNTFNLNTATAIDLLSGAKAFAKLSPTTTTTS